MQLKHAIGDTIRTLRHERNMTLRALSSESNMALGYISEVERGMKNTSHECLEALATGLGITTTELIGEIYAYLKEHDAEKQR